MTHNILSLPFDQERRPESGRDFDFGDETSTMIRPRPVLDDYETLAAAITPGIGVASEKAPSHDPLTRIEDKLNEALRSITKLNQRIDSIDAVLARLVNR
ncbi:MAG: hypothetical protein ACXV5L_13575 [Thermoanaerobaculia bacterium]